MKKVHLSYLSIAVVISIITTVSLSLIYPDTPQLVTSMSILVTAISGISVLLILATNTDGFLKIFRGTELEILEPITALGIACYLMSGVIVPLAWFEMIQIINISTTVFILYVITVVSTAFFLFSKTEKREESTNLKQTQTY